MRKVGGLCIVSSDGINQSGFNFLVIPKTTIVTYGDKSFVRSHGISYRLSLGGVILILIT